MEARLIALLFAAACTGKGSSAPSNSASGSASGSAGSAEPATPGPVVVDRATAIPNTGRQVTVLGTAKNAKLGAVVIAGNLPVYCLGIDHWADEIVNKQVAAHGRLEQTDEFSTDDDASAGAKGKVYVLRACAYDQPK